MSDSNPRLQERPLLRFELSRTARAFETEETVWRREIQRMFQLVENHTVALRGAAREQDEAHWRNRPQDRRPRARMARDEKKPLLSISIFGSYGSGKSSLLKTFRREANLEQSSLRPSGLDRRIFSLPVIEPNLQAKNEHFLYSFLATALEADLAQREEEQDAESLILSPVQQAFQDLSRYLQVIDEGEGSADYDPLGLSLERLDRHTSGLLLRDRLRSFVDTLCSTLAGPDKNSLILMPVDDADLSLHTLEQTLDTFRRYLMHPRLVPVFTFTARTAEELLRVSYARELSLRERQRMASEESERQEMVGITEKLALQYLGKLFPIRNRIRLGHAPARMQTALYMLPGDKERKKGQQVLDLLESASRLLFGAPDWPTAPTVRLSLRPPALRQQLQVIDAMRDSEVTKLREVFRRDQSLPELEAPSKPRKEKEGSTDGSQSSGAGKGGEPEPTWVQIFDRASWSLLNIHRTALKEVGLYVEDLHVWTPQTLRREILNAFFALDDEKLRTYFTRWHFRLEEPESQVLSLLVVNAFRPLMRGEEPPGDDPDRLRAWMDQGTAYLETTCPASFPVHQGVLWFLDLWISFYLPLILHHVRAQETGGRPVTRNRDDDDESISDLFQGVGWNLYSGPSHALVQTYGLKGAPGTSRLKLDDEQGVSALQKELTVELETKAKEIVGEVVGKSIEKTKNLNEEQRAQIADRYRDELGEDAAKLLTLYIWCQFGHRRGRPFAFLSFWRGVGLIGQILEDYDRSRESRADDEPNAEATPRQIDRLRKERIITLIRKHCATAHRGVEREKGCFNPWDWREGIESTDSQWKILRPTVELLADEIQGWLDAYSEQESPKNGARIYPHPPKPPHRERGDDTAAQEQRRWMRDFIRRLHGEYILGDFWPLMGQVELEEGDELSKDEMDPGSDGDDEPERGDAEDQPSAPAERETKGQDSGADQEEREQSQEREQEQEDEDDERRDAQPKSLAGAGAILQDWAAALIGYWGDAGSLGDIPEYGRGKGENDIEKVRGGSPRIGAFLADCPLLRPWASAKVDVEAFYQHGDGPEGPPFAAPFSQKRVRLISDKRKKRTLLALVQSVFGIASDSSDPTDRS